MLVQGSTHRDVLVGISVAKQSRLLRFLEFSSLFLAKKPSHFNAFLVFPVGGKSQQIPYPSKEGIWSLNGVFGAAWGPLEQIISSQGEGNGKETKLLQKGVVSKYWNKGREGKGNPGDKQSLFFQLRQGKKKKKKTLGEDPESHPGRFVQGSLCSERGRIKSFLLFRTFFFFLSTRGTKGVKKAQIQV